MDKGGIDAVVEHEVTLDTYNSDLHLNIDALKCSAYPLSHGVFALMWGGVRATHGAAEGTFCFEVKITEKMCASDKFSDPDLWDFRIGVSLDSSSLQLGEGPFSYGYHSSGKIPEKNYLKSFGPSYSVGDCVLCVVKFEAVETEIGFGKNGKFLGWAFKIKNEKIGGKALFPHISTKNYAFEVNFGQNRNSFSTIPDLVKDYPFIASIPADKRIVGTQPPLPQDDCEVIMMCGLPGSGKTYWALQHSKKYPNKRYNILSILSFIEKMKTNGKMPCIDMSEISYGASECVYEMTAKAAKLRRNFILDEVNIHPFAQINKIEKFTNFKRIAVVVMPKEEEFQKRIIKRNTLRDVTQCVLLEMKAYFNIPAKGSYFHDVIFSDLQRDEAQELVEKYNNEGKKAFEPPKAVEHDLNNGNRRCDFKYQNFELYEKDKLVREQKHSNMFSRNSYGVLYSEREMHTASSAKKFDNEYKDFQLYEKNKLIREQAFSDSYSDFYDDRNVHNASNINRFDKEYEDIQLYERNKRIKEQIHSDMFNRNSYGGLYNEKEIHIAPSVKRFDKEYEDFQLYKRNKLIGEQTHSDIFSRNSYGDFYDDRNYDYKPSNLDYINIYNTEKNSYDKKRTFSNALDAALNNFGADNGFKKRLREFDFKDQYIEKDRMLETPYSMNHNLKQTPEWSRTRMDFYSTNCSSHRGSSFVGTNLDDSSRVSHQNLSWPIHDKNYRSADPRSNFPIDSSRSSYNFHRNNYVNQYDDRRLQTYEENLPSGAQLTHHPVTSDRHSLFIPEQRRWSDMYPMNNPNNIVN